MVNTTHGLYFAVFHLELFTEDSVTDTTGHHEAHGTVAARLLFHISSFKCSLVFPLSESMYGEVGVGCDVL